MPLSVGVRFLRSFSIVPLWFASRHHELAPIGRRVNHFAFGGGIRVEGMHARGGTAMPRPPMRWRIDLIVCAEEMSCQAVASTWGIAHSTVHAEMVIVRRRCRT